MSDDTTKTYDARALAEAIRGKQPAPYAPPGGLVDKLHGLLPDWLSARAATLKKRQQMQDMERQTSGEER